MIRRSLLLAAASLAAASLTGAAASALGTFPAFTVPAQGTAAVEPVCASDPRISLLLDGESVTAVDVTTASSVCDGWSASIEVADGLRSFAPAAYDETVGGWRFVPGTSLTTGDWTSGSVVTLTIYR